MKKQNSYLLIILSIAMLLGNSCKKEDASNTVTDIDGNVYNIITIGTQVWMKENLKVSKYRNGDAIPNVTVNSAWNALTSGAYCDYENLPSNSTIYGKLYNWYAVKDTRNIAPAGWHVPTDAEWTTLETFLGDAVAGGKLKETGTIHWQTPNTGATNESNFTGLPGGARWSGIFSDIGQLGEWWTSTQDGVDIDYGIERELNYNYQTIYESSYKKENGYSVRCIKD